MALPAQTTELVTRIDAALPQTQCTRCGYPRCRDYATAIAEGKTDINRCPPGGEATLQALATLMRAEIKPLDPTCGTHQPRTRAVIDETICIGCRKCIDACPTDAILGARKLMHTVIVSECTGCELCVPPCPVDCIAMAPVAASADSNSLWSEYSVDETKRWRNRTEARIVRLQHRKPKRAVATKATTPGSIFPDRDTIRADIRAALERVRQKKSKPPGN